MYTIDRNCTRMIHLWILNALFSLLSTHHTPVLHPHNISTHASLICTLRRRLWPYRFSAPPHPHRHHPTQPRTVPFNPPSLYQEIHSLLKQMLDRGVVHESASPWAAPIVLVKKKYGACRFCVDYRKLKAVTQKKKPIPSPGSRIP